MNEHERIILQKLEEQVYAVMEGETTGHDRFHVERVLRNARRIAANENLALDDFVMEAGALLHDIADYKFHRGDEEKGPATAQKLLQSLDVPAGQVEKIVSIVREISYKGAGVPTPMSTKEGEVVQDADRLDALGAIGIARTFAYGGSRNRPIYDPRIKAVCHTSFAAYKTSTAPTINHFYEKLLLLKDKMNTDTGRKMAEERHAFMEEFLSRFYMEWDGRL